MRPILRFVSTFFLLNTSLTATSSPFQQPVDSFAKPELISKVSYPYVSKDTAPADPLVPIVRDTSFMQIDTKLRLAAIRLKQKGAMVKEYVVTNNFNDDVCFMVDMAIPSGKKRFFVYNFKKDSIEFSSMVSHGSGSYKPDCNDQLVFSNTPNSFATSLGRYKVGESYYGTYGLSYRLFGLDSTNSKAFERAIVLHSDAHVQEKETYPRHIYESAGCPIVAPSFLAVMGKYIKASKKPILMWIYN